MIVNAARTLFLEEGFGATSMDAIAQKARVSKPTLYSHFHNKEGLFSEVMMSLCCEMGAPLADEFSTTQSPNVVLKQLGHFMLKRALHPTGMALFRTVLAEAPKFPKLGQVFWQTGPQRFTEMVSQYLATLDREGVFTIPDPQAAAEQFRALIIGTYVLPTLMGVVAIPSDKELDRRLTNTVSAFFAILNLEMAVGRKKDA